MRIGGKTLTLNTATLRLPGKADTTLTIQAIPLGADERAARLFPLPDPPWRYATKTPTSNLVLRDESGAPIREPDTNDSEWQRISRERARLMTAYYVYHGLKADTAVEWSNGVASGDPDTAEHYAAVYDDLIAAGLSVGDVAYISRAIMSISGLDEDTLKEARDAFLSRAPGR
jgi:hypothetical protein